jgi:hypothetical protein
LTAADASVARSAEPDTRRERWRAWRTDAGLIALLLGANVMLREAILPRIPDQLVGGFSDVAGALFAKNPLRLLLPMPIETAGVRVHWTTTGLVLVDGLHRLIGLQWTYIVASGLCLAISYVGARLLSASPLVALTYASLFLFGNQLNYTFVHPHIGTFYLYYCYLTANLLAMAKLLLGERTRIWGWVFGLSLVALMMFLEVWLDYALFALVFLPLAALWGYRQHQPAVVRRAPWLWAAFILAAGLYVGVRAHFPDNLAIPGSEEEIVTRYPYPSLAISDVFSNILTYLYLCFATYLPSFFLGSLPLIQLGAEIIRQQQNNYSPQYLDFVVYHHIFIWYYYAGACATLFALAGIGAGRRAFACGSGTALAALGILILILAGCAALSLVKYRFYLSVPVLAYKCVTGTFGVAILIGFALDWLHRHRSTLLYRAGIAAAWVLILAAFVTHERHEIAFLKLIGLVAPDAKPFLSW